MGTQVIISGSDFTPTNNTIYFGSARYLNYNSMDNGTKIIFEVPGYITSNAVGSGAYTISVSNANGMSNSVPFTVLGNSGGGDSGKGGVCEYPVPPLGCYYYRGPNFNRISQCGLVLKCNF